MHANCILCDTMHVLTPVKLHLSNVTAKEKSTHYYLFL